jgi:ribosomal protection tetracycline resistance protein
VLTEIAGRLKVTAVAVGRVTGAGTHDASFAGSGADDAGFTAGLTELLADHSDGLLATYVHNEAGVAYDQLRAELAAQTACGQVYPVFFGSAATGAGIAPLMAGIAELLPGSDGDPDGPLSGSIFKIERAGRAEKIAYVRMFSGTVQVRDRLRLGSGLDDKVTAIAVFERGPAAQRPAVRAGQIGKLWGLADARIGDRIGDLAGSDARLQFPPPTLESAVVPGDPGDGNRLRVALGQLAEQDPLINLRQDGERQEIYVSLYGAVQKEVIQATLADDFNVAATFRETTMIYIERPLGGASPRGAPVRRPSLFRDGRAAGRARAGRLRDQVPARRRSAPPPDVHLQDRWPLQMPCDGPARSSASRWPASAWNCPRPGWATCCRPWPGWVPPPRRRCWTVSCPWSRPCCPPHGCAAFRSNCPG